MVVVVNKYHMLFKIQMAGRIFFCHGGQVRMKSARSARARNPILDDVTGIAVLRSMT